jgi:hypothetical protein
MKNNDALLNTIIADDLLSYERWLPAGGMMSNVPDLLRFGNVWLSSFKRPNGKCFNLNHFFLNIYRKHNLIPC